MKPRIKFNNGMGAILCIKCSKIIKSNLTKEEFEGKTDLLYCDNCKPKIMITKELFDQLPHGEVFSTGVLPNSEEGLFMTRDGGFLRWVAKKGYGNDWAIYCHWSDKTPEWVAENGDKVYNKSHITKCVPCDENVLKLYRF